MDNDEDNGLGLRNGRDSRMSVSISVSIGYERKRPNYRGDRWEARVDSIGLLLAGAAVALILLLVILPRILQFVGSL